MSTVKSERDELAILNENLNERCDMLITQNGKLKSQLHGEFNADPINQIIFDIIS